MYAFVFKITLTYFVLSALRQRSPLGAFGSEDGSRGITRTRHLGLCAGPGQHQATCR